MHNTFYIALVPVAIAIAASLPRPGNTLKNELRYAQRLQGRGRLEKIAYLTIDTVQELKSDSQFWVDSGRVRGLLERIGDLSLLVKFMQSIVLKKPRLIPKTIEMWFMVVAQLSFTLLALPEAAVHHIWAALPHDCARIATRWHVKVTYGIQNEFYDEDTPESIGNLY